MASILTFSDLREQVLEWMDEVGDEDTTKTLVESAIKASHRQRLVAERWNFMQWHKPETLSITANQQYYGLHPEVLFPIYFWNRTAQEYLEEVGKDTLRASQAQWTDEYGPASQFRFLGTAPVSAQPPTGGSTLSLASSSGADGSSQGFTIRGDTENGVTTETITVGGTGSTVFTRILNVTKVGEWNGIGTLTASSDSSTLLKLFASEYGRQHRQLVLTKIPTASETVEYAFYRQPSPLSADNDIPDIPAPFSQILVWDALLKISAYNAMERNSVAEWTENRDRLEFALRGWDQERMTLDAATNYIRYIER